eukprot:g26958.t1
MEGDESEMMVRRRFWSKVFLKGIEFEGNDDPKSAAKLADDALAEHSCRRDRIAHISRYMLVSYDNLQM